MYRLIALNLQESLNKTVFPAVVWIICLYASLMISIFVIKKSGFSLLRNSLKIHVNHKSYLIRIYFSTIISLIFLIFDGRLINIYLLLNKPLIIKLFVNFIIMPFSVLIWLILIKGRWEKLWSISLKIVNIVAILLTIFILGINLFFIFNFDRKEDLNKNTNIILISVSSLRADHLGCYGYERSTSLNIDKLARDGILFKNAISVSPWPYPSLASLLTSQSPPVLNIRSWKSNLDNKFLSLAELLKNYHYATYGLVAKPMFNLALGIDQGFDVFNCDIGKFTNMRDYIGSQDIVKKGICFFA